MHKTSPILAGAIISLLALGSLTLNGCASQPTTTSGGAASKPAETAAKPTEAAVAERANYFLVFHENGRLYAFSDPALYLLFLEHDEVPLTRTRIGGGPAGQTVIIGLTKKEAKLPLDKPTQTEQFFDGKIDAVAPFYGEAIYNGRYYVFGAWEDMKAFLQHMEVPYAYTEIGVGPKGETVVYYLNKKTKNQGSPTALIEAFKKLHQKK